MEKIKYLIAGLTTIVFSEVILILFGLGLLFTLPKFALYTIFIIGGIFIGLVLASIIEPPSFKFGKKKKKQEEIYYEEGTLRDIFQ